MLQGLLVGSGGSGGGAGVNTATQTALDLKENSAIVLTATLSVATNIDVTALSGYDSSDTNLEVRIEGTLTQNTTLTLPAVSSTKKKILIIDVDGNGLTSPDYTMLIQPDGSDSMTSSDGILVDQYDLDQDYETVLFQSNNATTKWEAI